MIRDIVRDTFFLSIPSEKTVYEDRVTADDLLDTLKANSERCVGMAANMIGVSKRIIVFTDGTRNCEMFDPVILKCSDPYETEEGCLSLDGTRKTKRYRSIRVQWVTRDGKTRIKNYSDFTAQIIQHEIDHLNGIVI